MGEKPIVMKNVSRTQAAKAGKRKPWWKGEYQATAKKEIAKPEEKIGKYYSAEDKKAKLKASLVPGAVVILLAGRFKGKRAVFLKQLDSGLCLITGPYKVNGIPLRRVPQSYVIGTSTVVDVSGAEIPEEVNDAMFKKPKSAKKKSEDGPFASEEEKAPLSQEFKDLQEKVDSAVVKAIESEDLLKGYMKSKFSLKRGQYPHEMSF